MILRSSVPRYALLLLVAGFGLGKPEFLCAADWPQWGGNDPGRNMYSPEKNLPDSFYPGKFDSAKDQFDQADATNVKWIAKLGSMAFGNVVVSGGKVFIGTNNESPRDPKHPGDRSILMVFDEQTGEFLWQLVIPKLAAGKVNDWENLGLVSGPTVEGNRVYVVTTRCEVLCLTTVGLAHGNVGPFTNEAQYFVGPGKPPVPTGRKDADIVWRYDMIDELNVFPHNSTRTHPIIVGDLIYLGTSNGVDWTHQNVPSPLAPSMIALDKRTGNLAACDDADIGPRIYHGQWGSPCAGRVGDRSLIFYGAGDGVCYAFDAKAIPGDSERVLHTAWKVNCNPGEYFFKTKEKPFFFGLEGAGVLKIVDPMPLKYPDAEGPSEILATPVFWRDRVYVATGQDPEHGEGFGNLVCLDATITEKSVRPGVLWRSKIPNRSMSTVSITPDGLLFLADFSGFVHCFDAVIGQHYWSHDLKAHIWGSTLVADDKVYIGNEDGDLCVFAASKEKRLISTISLMAPIYSTPVAANGVLYISSNTHLFAIHTSHAVASKAEIGR